MKRVIKSFLISVLLLVSIEQKSFAYSSDPEKFIGEIIDEAKTILSSGSNQKTKADKLSEIALKTVDIKGLAYYTLGKKRKEISPEELKV